MAKAAMTEAVTKPVTEATVTKAMAMAEAAMAEAAMTEEAMTEAAVAEAAEASKPPVRIRVGESFGVWVGHSLHHHQRRQCHGRH